MEMCFFYFSLSKKIFCFFFYNLLVFSTNWQFIGFPASSSGPQKSLFTTSFLTLSIFCNFYLFPYTPHLTFYTQIQCKCTHRSNRRLEIQAIDSYLGKCQGLGRIDSHFFPHLLLCVTLSQNIISHHFTLA